MLKNQTHTFRRTLISLLLCTSLLISALPLTAKADDQNEQRFTVIHEDEISALIEDYLAENRIPREKIGIGFLYTGTGEEWYYNGDISLYSASLYKVPLLMLVSNKVAKGELDQDDTIKGYKLTDMEEAILTVSNNRYSHLLMDYFWPANRDCRLLWPALADMEMDELPKNFENTSFFNPKFVTRIFYELYSNSDNYPMMLDYLKQAAPNQYFRYKLEGKYDVAQKMGYYEQYHHTAGIIYTEHPIIVTYMTEDVPAHGSFSGDLALRLAEYAETLDARLHEKEAAERELAEAEARKLEEEARKAEDAQEAREVEEQLANEIEIIHPQIEANAEALQMHQRATVIVTLIGAVTVTSLLSLCVWLFVSRKHH